MRTLNNSLCLLSSVSRMSRIGIATYVEFNSRTIPPFTPQRDSRHSLWSRDVLLLSRRRGGCAHRKSPRVVQNIYTIARTHVECADALYKSWSDLKRRYDARRRDIALPIDSTVLVRLTDYERAKFSCRKLAPRWSDPAVVLRALSCGKVYEIRRAGGKVENINIARLLPLTAGIWTSQVLHETEKATEVPAVLVSDDFEDKEVVVRSVPSTPAQVPGALRSFSAATPTRSIWIEGNASSASVPRASSSPSESKSQSRHLRQVFKGRMSSTSSPLLVLELSTSIHRIARSPPHPVLALSRAGTALSDGGDVVEDASPLGGRYPTAVHSP